MVKASMLRFLLSDNESLQWYVNGRKSEADDVIRRLFLCERLGRRSMPDHYYRLQQDNDFQGLTTIADLLRKGLFRLGDDYLELHNQRIHVKASRLNEWQQLITFIPPLVLQCAFLHLKRPQTDITPGGLSSYTKDILLPNFKYTALPFPRVPQIEHYLATSHGFHDLHMHLNGATETDVTWQDHLLVPKKIYTEMAQGFKNSKVKEQFEQESNLLEPNTYYNLLLIARKIRTILYDIVVLKKKHSEKSTDQLLSSIVNDLEKEQIIPNYKNPFLALVNENLTSERPMLAEALFYIRVFSYLAAEPRESVASLFHFYLLILGLCNRLLVQQVHQFGFEQFQKHTLNGLREISEKQYRNRFFQLQGNELRNLAFLEGRFSPKETEKETLMLLKAVNSGWQKLKDKIMQRNAHQPPPELRLTAHFIKRAEGTADEFIRFLALRQSVWKKAKVLALLKKNNAKFTEAIVGIDAAASEFDTPPEIFAPAFRLLRRKNFEHFTFHAGEDFFHLISGMRAIYEAISFNDLRSGDRIGHATALGLSAEQWCMAMGDRILIRQGEWFDNLIFCYHLCLQSSETTLKKRVPELVNDIQHYSWEIYRQYYSSAVLERAWLARKFCPILFFKNNLEDAQLTSVFDEDEWSQIRLAGFNPSDDVYQLNFQYHLKVNRPQFEKIISVKTEEIFTAHELGLLQKEMLAYMHQKEIVIETLPTSNVRIGHHYDYGTYHLWNWLKWSNEGVPVPPIVVGTDDTGIFATNIFNEFANIYCHLTSTGKMSHTQAIEVVSGLDKTGSIYRFI